MLFLLLDLFSLSGDPLFKLVNLAVSHSGTGVLWEVLEFFVVLFDSEFDEVLSKFHLSEKVGGWV